MSDTPEPDEPASPDASDRVRRVLGVDLALLGLAVASLVILALQWTVPLRPAELTFLTWVDRAAIAGFGLSLAARVGLAEDAPRRLKRRWPELVGLLPLVDPTLTTLRFYPLVQIAVVVTRLSSGLDRHLGERALRRLLDRYSHMVTEEIGDRVLIRAADAAESIALKGRYAASLGESLDARRDDVHGSVDRGLQGNPLLRQVSHLPGVPRIVKGTVDVTLDAAVAQLTSPEMDRIVREVIHRTLEDFRTEVERKEWKERGLRPSRPEG